MDERARGQTSEDEIHSRLDQVMEVKGGLLAFVLNVEHNLLTVQQQLQSVVEQLQQYNRNKSILGEGLTASVEKGSSSRVVVHNSFRQESSSIPRQEHQIHQNTGTYSALNKMEFPYFDGENSRGWVRRCARQRLKRMLEHIRETNTLKEAWDTFAKLFSKKNDTKLQLIESELLSVAQRNLTVAQYFHKVKSLCREICELDPEAPIGEARMKRIIIHGQEALAKQMGGVSLKNDEEALYANKGRRNSKVGGSKKSDNKARNHQS
ncbi:hypothetical protein Sango_2887400 [Sesamum angolense]|uniref:Retrotransposon gag domain-containing protein n=1 Tax=Sesamum angolense TaxID=2727404 RepID=A0AAE1W099_9LAMI|nr:hypothetical protein Sango_2887400 [Sesamum angolense]